MSLEYWLGITECDCDSPHPTGGCLRCDLELMLRFTDATAQLVRELEVRGLRCLTAEVKKLMHEIRNEDPLNDDPETETGTHTQVPS